MATKRDSLASAVAMARSPREFTYKELSIATRGFDASRVIGNDEFGVVYKGIVPDTGATMAVLHQRERGWRAGAVRVPLRALYYRGAPPSQPAPPAAAAPACSPATATVQDTTASRHGACPEGVCENASFGMGGVAGNHPPPYENFRQRPPYHWKRASAGARMGGGWRCSYSLVAL
jgi:hypothetical protein